MGKPDRLPNYFRGGGYSSGFLTEGGMPVTMSRLNLVKGVGPVLQIAEGAPPSPTRTMTICTSAPTRPRVQRTRAHHLVRPPPLRLRPLQGHLLGDGRLGSQSRRRLPRHVCRGLVGADLITLANIFATSDLARGLEE